MGKRQPRGNDERGWLFLMTEQMMKEILEDWTHWRFDIWESNKSTWNTRDNSKLEMIGVILQEKMKELQGDK